MLCSIPAVRRQKSMVIFGGFGLPMLHPRNSASRPTGITRLISYETRCALVADKKLLSWRRGCRFVECSWRGGLRENIIGARYGILFGTPIILDFMLRKVPVLSAPCNRDAVTRSHLPLTTTDNIWNAIHTHNVALFCTGCWPYVLVNWRSVLLWR